MTDLLVMIGETLKHYPIRAHKASYLGLTLETVSRAFSRLRRNDVVSYDRHDGPMKVDIGRLKPLTGTY